MAENCTCSAFFDDSRRTPMSGGRRHRSTQGYAPTSDSKLQGPAAIAGVSVRFSNQQLMLYYGDGRQNWVKPARLTPTFTSRRDTPRKFLASFVPHPQPLQTIAHCANDFSTTPPPPHHPPSSPPPPPCLP